jgi:hypothetical protein
MYCLCLESLLLLIELRQELTEDASDFDTTPEDAWPYGLDHIIQRLLGQVGTHACALRSMIGV